MKKIGDNDMAGVFQDIKNGNPVFTGGFHTDLSTVMVKEPFFESFEVSIDWLSSKERPKELL